MKLIVIWAIIILMVLAPVWWWATRGMSAHIGIAWVLTDLVFGLVALIVTAEDLV